MGTATKASNLAIIALVVCSITLAATTLAIITVNQNIASSGIVTTTPNIGVYSDIACTQNITTINWGTIAAGSSVSQTIYVKNTGTGTMTLSMATSNWTPAGASTYITITFDKQGTQIASGQSTTATLTLTVSSNISGITNFSNSITISGTG
jgi:hypothetical protein